MSECTNWFYDEKVKDHFFKPRNIFKSEDEIKNFNPDGIGMVGSPQCGDAMKFFIKVDKNTEKITDCKWQTFGCATAIASTSMFSEMIIGRTISDVFTITAKDIADKLGGIPAKKFHCSVLADRAFREAVNDYYRKTGQEDKVIEKKAAVIDAVLKITDADIEHAVLDGALTFEDVQKKTKVGVHDKDCIPKVKELIEKFKNKYFGEDD
jgi:NifU-like protein involved in Fe-S cluster formation/bacterioferritin-associated ferredoxin